MFHDSWWQRIFNTHGSRTARRKQSGDSTRLMELEVLEDRWMPANITILVTGTADVLPAAVTPLHPTGPNTFTAANLRSAVTDIATKPLHGNITILLSTATYVLDQGQLNLGSTLIAGDSVRITNDAGGLSTIDAQESNRIFALDGGNITLDHLVLTNGAAPAATSTTSYGGAIFNGGSNLTLTNDQITNNQATGSDSQSTDYGGSTSPENGEGGGVFNAYGGTLTVKNTLFSGNTATGGAGIQGPGAGAEGGAICIGSDSGPVSITASTFTNNQATGGTTSTDGSTGGIGLGGAIELVQEARHLTVVNSTFANNIASGGDAYGGSSYGGNAYGGAILTQNQNTVNLANDTIALNQVFGGEGGDSGQTGTGSGGGVANFGGEVVNIVNTIIAENQAVHSDAFPSETTPNDIFGEFNSLGHNLVGNTDTGTGFVAADDLTGTTASPLDPGFVGGTNPTLAANGGPTETLALAPTSPAINAGNNNVVVTNSALLKSLGGISALTTDQRGAGFNRLSDQVVDIGAYEFQMNLDKFYSFHSSTTKPVTFTVATPGLLLGIDNSPPLPAGQSYGVELSGSAPGQGTVLALDPNGDGGFSFTVPARFRNTVQFNFTVVILQSSEELGGDPTTTVMPTNLIFTATLQVVSTGGGRGSARTFLGL
jgi:hypothetical protein